MSTTSSAVLALAENELAHAQEVANVTMRELHDAHEAAEASLLLDNVWNVGKAGTTQLEPGLLVALAHSGNYVGGAFDNDTNELIGVTVGFFGRPLGKSMHSHIAGVRHDQVGRGTGAAMKLHQRLWCLNHGIMQMTWTFDPLIARNAAFNFRKLGVYFVDYYEDFYGQMRDGVNAGQASDRMMVSWSLGRAPKETSSKRLDEIDDLDMNYALHVGDSGEPVESDVPRSTTYAALQIPADVETLRGADAELASQWRHALRRGIVQLTQDGWDLAGLRKDNTYIFTHD